MDTTSSHQDDAARLRALFTEKASLSQMAFGERYGLGTQSMVSQYLLGRRPLNVESVMKFAEGLGCTINDISPSLARKISQASSYVLLDRDDESPVIWQSASDEAKEVARFALASHDAPLPPWADKDIRKDMDSMRYAALRWLRSKQNQKKDAA